MGGNMRLRNKKTGEIKAFGNLQVYAEAENSNESQFLGNFNSFKQIFEYYEDYIPKEPIIKDEEIISFISLLERLDRKLSKLCGEEEE